MNSNTRTEIEKQTISAVCRNSCRKMVAQMQKARRAITAQFRGAIAEHDQALRLALNEAEALAWETPFPHLFFADLAEEKAQTVASWSERQRAIRLKTAGIAG